MRIPPRAVAALLVLALLARLGAAVVLGGTFHFVDETNYVDAARRLLAGAGFGAGYDRVPAYPVLLALLGAPLPSSVVLLRGAQAALAAAGGLLLLTLAVRMFGPGPALVATLLYAIDPLLVIAGALLYPEAAAALVLVAATLAAWEAARHDRLGAAAAAGFLVGMLSLLRPVGIVVLPVLVLWMAATVAAKPARRAVHAGAAVLLCLIALAPWTYRNYRLHGQLEPVATAGTHNAPVSRAEIARYGLTASLLRKACEEPGVLAARVVHEYVRFWELYPTRLSTDGPAERAKLHERDPRLPLAPTFPRGLRDVVSALSFGGELVLAAVGIGVAWRRHRSETILLGGVMLAYALGYSLFVGKLRYRIPVLPHLFVFAGVGAAALQAAFASRARRRRAGT